MHTLRLSILFVCFLAAQTLGAEPTCYQLLAEHNKVRQQYRLPTFEVHEDMDVAAEFHVKWMAKNRRLKHQGLQGLMNKGWMTCGENIAKGQTTEKEVMSGWMRSSGHKKNILNWRFTHIGLGIARARNGTLYWCAVFGGK